MNKNKYEILVELFEKEKRRKNSLFGFQMENKFVVLASSMYHDNEINKEAGEETKNRFSDQIQ